MVPSAAGPQSKEVSYIQKTSGLVGLRWCALRLRGAHSADVSAAKGNAAAHTIALTLVLHLTEFGPVLSNCLLKAGVLQ